MEFVQLACDEEQIQEMSALATEIVREHFDPIIGKEQNDYMIARSQSPEAIRDQLEGGSQYFFVEEAGRKVGFLAFYPKGEVMYLSKFYLRKEERGRGYSHAMLAFLVEQTREAGLPAIELNVNRNNDAIKAYEKLGFTRDRAEKVDIGGGFYMDDYIYRLEVG